MEISIKGSLNYFDEYSLWVLKLEKLWLRSHKALIHFIQDTPVIICARIKHRLHVVKMCTEMI